MDDLSFRFIGVLLFGCFVLWASDSWRSGEGRQAAGFAILAALMFIIAMWR